MAGEHAPDASKVRDLWLGMHRPKPRMDFSGGGTSKAEPSKFDFTAALEQVSRWIDHNKFIILGVIAAIAVAVVVIVLLRARRTGKAGRRLAAGSGGAAAESAARKVPSARSLEEALALASGGDWSRACVCLRRAWIAELRERRLLRRDAEYGTSEIALTIAKHPGSAGSSVSALSSLPSGEVPPGDAADDAAGGTPRPGPDAAYRKLSRFADTVLFGMYGEGEWANAVPPGDRLPGEADWDGALAAYRAWRGAP